MFEKPVDFLDREGETMNDWTREGYKVTQVKRASDWHSPIVTTWTFDSEDLAQIWLETMNQYLEALRVRDFGLADYDRRALRELERKGSKTVDFPPHEKTGRVCP
jgi:hypothetical protein